MFSSEKIRHLLSFFFFSSSFFQETDVFWEWSLKKDVKRIEYSRLKESYHQHNLWSCLQYLEINHRETWLTESDPRSIFVELYWKVLPIAVSFFVFCSKFWNGYELVPRMKVTDHKHLFSCLVNHDIYYGTNAHTIEYFR